MTKTERNKALKRITQKEINTITNTVQDNGYLLASGNVKYDKGFTITNLCSTSLNQGRNIYLFVNGSNKYIVNTAYSGYHDGDKYYVKDILKVSDHNIDTLQLLVEHGRSFMFD